ncbi:MAG: WD40/YVTN/BNR-like repeat-containing protein [Terriglobales bacterium]
MNFPRTVVLTATILLATLAFTQTGPTFTPQSSGTTATLIGLSPVNSNVVWASGSGGTFVVTTDGGKHWHAGVVPGAEALPFRDVQGISDKVAYLLSIGSGTDSRIYRTTDGGATWTAQFINQNPDAFYDCFAFWNKSRAVAMSDSANGRFPILRTTDGQTWQDIGDNVTPALAGEAGFASSGTCIATQGGQRAWFTTGGATPARVIATTDGGDTWNAYPIPLVAGGAGGGFSIAFRDANHGVVGGGDLANGTGVSNNFARSSDGGLTWTLTNPAPINEAIFGLAYAQGAEAVGRTGDNPAAHTVVATGRKGTAWSPDEGDTWFALPQLNGLWTVAFANPKAGWLAGSNGQIVKVSF